MPLDIPSFKKSLKSAFKKIESTQAEALNIELAKNYLAGRAAGEKHQSFNYQNVPKSNESVVSQDLSESINIYQIDNKLQEYDNKIDSFNNEIYCSDNKEEDLSDEDKEELALLLALFLGNLKKFNAMAQDQILSQVSTMVAEGKTTEEIKQYVDDVFHGKEPIVVDNTGKKKKELYVDKDLKISERDKIISKPFFIGLTSYATMLAENAAHRAYETGRKSQYRKDGFGKWMFVGPSDERARPHHVALLGSIFEFGSAQSNYAEKVLQEPRCRHRAQIYSEKDSNPEYWQKLKDESGLFWNTQTDAWDMRD